MGLLIVADLRARSFFEEEGFLERTILSFSLGDLRLWNIERKMMYEQR
jgi:hypothetical protein